LFERDQVMPPVSCSRCGREVAASSLFCPRCGQSMLRPFVPEVSDHPIVDTPGDGEQEQPSVLDRDRPVSQTKDTFSRAADWLRRLGKIRDDDEEPRQSATIGETVQAAREQALNEPLTGDETMALPLFDNSAEADVQEPVRLSSRGQRRFVLKVSDGRQFTIGDIPGGIGADEDHPSPDGGPWQWLHVPGEESVDPVHVYFGSENGVLWVADQRTAFGTVVIEPGREPISCVAGEKYFVIRGSHIRLGGISMTLH
jgi:hypothetical protein